MLNREIITDIKSEVSLLDSVVKYLNTMVNIQNLGQMPVEIAIEEELKLVLLSLATDILFPNLLILNSR